MVTRRLDGVRTGRLSGGTSELHQCVRTGGVPSGRQDEAWSHKAGDGLARAEWFALAGAQNVQWEMEEDVFIRDQTSSNIY